MACSQKSMSSISLSRAFSSRSMRSFIDFGGIPLFSDPSYFHEITVNQGRAFIFWFVGGSLTNFQITGRPSLYDCPTIPFGSSMFVFISSGERLKLSQRVGGARETL